MNSFCHGNLSYVSRSLLSVLQFQMTTFGTNIYDPRDDDEDRSIKDIIARGLNGVQEPNGNKELATAALNQVILDLDQVWLNSEAIPVSFVSWIEDFFISSASYIDYDNTVAQDALVNMVIACRKFIARD